VVALASCPGWNELEDPVGNGLNERICESFDLGRVVLTILVDEIACALFF